MKAVAPLAVLFELLHPYGFNAVQTEEYISKLGTESGKFNRPIFLHEFTINHYRLKNQ